MQMPGRRLYCLCRAEFLAPGPRRLPPPRPLFRLKLVHDRAPKRKNAGHTFTRWPDVLKPVRGRERAATLRTPCRDACIIVKSAGLSTPFAYLIFAPPRHPCASPLLVGAAPLNLCLSVSICGSNGGRAGRWPCPGRPACRLPAWVPQSMPQHSCWGRVQPSPCSSTTAMA